MPESGLLTEVRWEWDGTTVLEAAVTTDTEVVVDDISDLAIEDLIWISETGPYVIEDIDEDTATVTLATPLTVDVEEGDPVVPDVGAGAAKVWTAICVMPDADGPIEVPLTVHDLGVMAEGTYDPPWAIVLDDALESVVDLPGQRPVVTGSDVPPDSGLPDPGEPTVPEASPLPVPLEGPASVVVNYTPIPGQWADLYVWVPPDPSSPGDDWDTPPVLDTVDDLHTQEFPNGGFVYVDKNGINLPTDRPIWVALWGRNTAGEAPVPSDWVESRVGQIQPENMVLLVGSLIAQRLQSETLQSVTITASILDIVDALYASPGYLDVKAQLLEAQSAIFHDNVTRRGLNNYLTGREIAANGVPDPTVAPTVTAYWPTVSLAIPEEQTAEPIVGMMTDAASGVREVFVLSTPLRINVYNLDTGAFKREIRHELDTDALAITMDSTRIYVAQIYPTDDRVSVARYYRAGAGTEGNEDVGWIGLDLFGVAALDARHAVGIGLNNGFLHAAYINASKLLRYNRWDLTTALPAVTTFSLKASTIPNSLGKIAALQVTKPATPYVLTLQLQNDVQQEYTLNSGGTAVASDQVLWDRPYGANLVGQSGYYALDATGTLYQYATSSYGSEQDYTFTWYDSDAGGLGTAESKPGPAREFLRPKGSFVNVKTALPPDDGSNDAPDTVRVYVDDHLQGAAYSSGELTTGRNLDVIDTGSAAAPSVSGFAGRASALPGGYESFAEMTGGDPVWQLDGDGTAHLGGMDMNEDGLIVRGFDVPHTRRHRSSTVSVISGFGGTGQVIPFASLDYEDAESSIVHSSGTFTVTYPGLYLINANITWDGNATGKRAIAIAANNTQHTRQEAVSAGNSDFAQSVSAQVRLAAGENFDVRVWQNSGSGLNIEDATDTGCHMSATLIAG